MQGNDIFLFKNLGVGGNINRLHHLQPLRMWNHALVGGVQLQACYVSSTRCLGNSPNLVPIRRPRDCLPIRVPSLCLVFCLLFHLCVGLPPVAVEFLTPDVEP